MLTEVEVYQIPSLYPPVEKCFSDNSGLAYPNQTICQVEDMLEVFNIFCHNFVQFMTQAIFKCSSSTNAHEISCNLRKFDVSGGEIYGKTSIWTVMSTPLKQPTYLPTYIQDLDVAEYIENFVRKFNEKKL